MTPYYSDELVQIFLGDCREIVPAMPMLGASGLGPNAIITDPPWGVGIDTNNARFCGGSSESAAKRGAGKDYGRPIIGDDEQFDPRPWLDFPCVVLWGANHFAEHLPRGTWLTWIKRNDEAFGTFLSDAELAWMKGGAGVYCKRDLSNNGIANERVHPTQKPVPLMGWCIQMAKVPAGGLILDPYAGSGSTLVAAKLGGYRAVGIEMDERYCEAAANRCRQGVLFGATA